MPVVNIKAGEVVSLKTTGEYVYVTGKTYDSGEWEVRRPQLTRDGIKHSLDSFQPDELETVAEHIQREVDESLLKMNAQQKLLDAKMKSMASVEPDEPDFKLN